MNDIPFYSVANLTSDPDGTEVLNDKGITLSNVRFGLAVTPRRRNSLGEWSDSETTYLRAVVWNDQALNVADSLTKGDRVVIIGRLVTRSYTRNGQLRTTTEVVVDEIGPALRWATAVPTKVAREVVPTTASTSPA